MEARLQIFQQRILSSYFYDFYVDKRFAGTSHMCMTILQVIMNSLIYDS
jgi:hypothetical protein